MHLSSITCGPHDTVHGQPPHEPGPPMLALTARTSLAPRWALSLLALLATGCLDEAPNPSVDEPEAEATGADGQPCSAEGACDAGLTCGQGSICGAACLKIDRTEGLQVIPPAGVRAPFRVLDCDGRPVRALQAGDLRLINDDAGADFAAAAVSPPGAPSDLGLFTVLALDQSDSVFAAGIVGDLADAADTLVQRLVVQAPEHRRH